MSTRERAMLPAAERVNSIFTADVEKAQFLQRLANMLDDFLSGKAGDHTSGRYVNNGGRDAGEGRLHSQGPRFYGRRRNGSGCGR